MLTLDSLSRELHDRKVRYSTIQTSVTSIRALVA